MGTIGRIAAFRLNFLGNTKIGLGKYRHMEQGFFFTSVNICPITMFFGKYM